VKTGIFISRAFIISIIVAFALTPQYSKAVGCAPTEAPTYSFFTAKRFPFDFLLSGYVYHGSYWDTRQVVGINDDHDLAFPERAQLDTYDNDINAKGQFSMCPFQTSLRLDATGPDINGMTAKGTLSTIFTGQSFTLATELRELHSILTLYEAYLQFTWPRTDLIVGYHWHPIYVLKNAANMISFNAGAPLAPLARDPQIRVTQKCGENSKFIFAALSQNRFLTNGPIGFSSTYIRNAVMPNLHAQFQTNIGDHLLGAGVDFKRIVPRLKTNTGLKTDEHLLSWAGILYAGLNFNEFVVRTQLGILQNGDDLSVIGGYAVHSIDPITDRRSYTNLNTCSLWMDVERQSERGCVQPGLFLGFAKSLGSRNSVVLDDRDGAGIITDRRVFGFGTDIDTLVRVSPRVRWNMKNMTVGAELEYTRAAFGTLNTEGKVDCTDPVGNVRFLVALFYYF
jgi:hypothetical protein